MKRHVSLFGTVKTSAAELFVSLTFVLQFLLGWSNQTEVQLSVFFHFNQRIQNRQTDPSVCIGPFSSDVSKNCGFDHHSNEMDCFKCYPHGCRKTRNFLNITSINPMVGINGTENNKYLKRILDTKSTLFIDLEVKCTWLKTEPFLKWYVNWCEFNIWPNDRKPKCHDTTTTRAVTETTLTHPAHSVTWTTTSTTSSIPITSYSNFTRSRPVTNQTPFEYRQKYNSTPAGFGEQSKKNSNGNPILWISLGAAAVVFTVAVLIILFCQRAKIATFLRKSGNPDIVDDAFYYRDLSMKRHEHQPAPDIVTYENIIPNILLNEPIREPVYTELENSNPENAAAGINSMPIKQKRDLKSYVDSVIYAELHKC